MELYLRTMLRQVDSSLLDEWEKMRDPDYQPLGARGVARRRSCGRPAPRRRRRDITRDTKAFTAAIRTRIFTFLRAWSIGDADAALAALDSPRRRRRRAVDARSGCARRSRPTAPSTSACASTPRRATSATPTCRRPTTAQTWRVQQMLVDPEMDNDWVAEFEVDLAASREADEPVIRLRRLGRSSG